MVRTASARSSGRSRLPERGWCAARGTEAFSPFPVAPATASLLRAASAFLDAGLSWDWSDLDDSLALLERSHAGHDVLADQYPYTAGSTTLLALLPDWAVAGGMPAMRERLADQAARRRLAGDLARRERGELLPGERELDPDSVVIADLPAGPLERHRASSLAKAARDEGCSVGELVLRLLDAAPAGLPIVWHGMDEADVRLVLAHPLVAVASDGWTLDPALGGVPHPRSYGTFVRVLGRYALGDRVLSLEAAVRKMTSLPARRLGLADRGTVAAGMAADLVVFDPDRVIDRATYERPHVFCEGVSHVVVNGHLVIDDGHDTGTPAGQVLRHTPRP